MRKCCLQVRTSKYACGVRRVINVSCECKPIGQPTDIIRWAFNSDPARRRRSSSSTKVTRDLQSHTPQAAHTHIQTSVASLHACASSARRNLEIVQASQNQTPVWGGEQHTSSSREHVASRANAHREFARITLLSIHSARPRHMCARVC